MTRRPRGRLATSIACVLVVGCADDGAKPGGGDAGRASGGAAASGGAPGGGGASDGGKSASGGRADGDAAPPPDAPFERPDGAPYTPQAGTCGFDTPAFCDTFEDGPKQGGRSGELDPVKWAVTRGGPSSPPSLGDTFPIGPALIPACRPGLPARAVPDSDVFVCDPTGGVPSRHLLTVTAAQNYGLSTYRIRQPFDFAGRTGTLKFDVNLTNNGLGGWPAVSISADPSPAPSFDWEERGSGPKNGIEIEFSSGWCNTKQTLEVSAYTFRDYVQTTHRAAFDCETPHVTTSPDALNHVEIYLTSSRVEVWVSEPSPDGTTFPDSKLLFAADVDLGFDRGSVNLIGRNHATMKYWTGSAWPIRWDNVGFDGPVVGGLREYDVPDSLSVTTGLDGCRIDGECQWRGDVIAANPAGGDGLCSPETSCEAEGEGRNVGWAVPRDDEEPVALRIPGVDLEGAKRARLVFAATYPWFEWSGASKPPSAIALRYRLNGGAFHDWFIDAAEENAFEDFFPDIGGAGHGAGFLNQVLDIDLAELRSGENVVELQSSGTWTGEYRAGVVGMSLVLDTE